MSISENEVSKIAKLARIAISEEEKKIFTEELSKILAVVDEMKKAKTEMVEHITSIRNKNLVMRPDIVCNDVSQNLILQNAVTSQFNCFVVPKVIE